MRRRRQSHGGHASSERWLLTYADLITLLLAFFVILYALSQVDKHKYDTLSQSLSQSLHVISTGGDQAHPFQPSSSNPVTLPITPRAAEQEQLEKLKAKVLEEASKAGMEGRIQAHVEERGLRVSLSDTALFQPGDDEIEPDKRKILAKIGHILASAHHPVRVEGHTDNTPIATARFPSNWELSTGRSTNVVRFLIDRHRIPPQLLSAAGYGEFHPLFPNDTEAHKAQNRRVDLILLRTNTMTEEPDAAPPKPQEAR